MAKPSMAGKSNHSSSPPPVTVKIEHKSAPPSTPTPPPATSPAPTPAPLQQRLDVKGEPLDHTTGESMASLKGKVNETLFGEPRFLKSLNELGELASAIDAFRRRYDELQKHLDFIHNAIDSRSKCTGASSSSLPPLLPKGHPTEKPIVPITPAKQIDTENVKSPEKHELKLLEGNDNSANRQQQDQSSTNELKSLCEIMSSRGLRKYIITHLSDIAKLREEVPVALKRALNPGKLVLECFGRFFLQGSRAYCKDSPMIPSRLASILILEFFLLMMNGCNEEVKIESSVKADAESAAKAWRKRLIVEGGISQASEIDSRGLLLLVASFGIPAGFRNDEIGHLIHSCNSSEIANALRQSRVLLAKIPGIIEEMMKNGMNVEAVDIAYTFGIEDKFSPQIILTPFLRDAKEAWKRKRRDSNNSLLLLKEANTKHLAALKSVIKCLEDRKIDPAKLLPGWQIRDKIINLEKDNVDLDKKLGDKAMSKRKVDEIESSGKLNSHDMKRSRFTSKASPLVSLRDHVLNEQGASSHAVGKSSYESFMSINPSNGGLYGHINNYPAASAPQYGSSLHSTGAYPGVRREMLVDQVGQTMNHNGPSYGFNDRLARQTYFVQPSSIGVDNLFGALPSIEGFAGLPDHPSVDAAKHSSTADLYRFADSVVEGELHQSSSSREAYAIPPHHASTIPPHHSSVVPPYHSSVTPSYHSTYM